MTGDINDERLEGEFGIFRGLNGRNYYMSVEHCQNGLKLQRIKLFSRRDKDIFLEPTENDCCKQALNEKELEQLDSCFEDSSDISNKEKSTLYYISGYVCRKENLQTESAPMKTYK